MQKYIRMTTEENVYAEVKNTFKSYDEAGLIDPISLRTWLHREIKRFGNNLMVDTDDVLQVKKGVATLPRDFWSLREVWKYELSHYCMEEENPRVLSAANASYLSNCACDCSKTTNVSNTVTYKEQEIKIYYNSPQILRIAPGFNRRAIHKDCVNLPSRVQKRDNNTVRLNGRTLHTEFSEGFLYVIYKAMPMDDEGNIILPETQHDRLRVYLEYFLKKKLVEEWLMNNDDPNLINKLQYLRQESDNAFELAMTELKATVLDPSVWKTLRNENRRRHRKFENLIPKI
jgi:hypothetical protein